MNRQFLALLILSEAGILFAQTQPQQYSTYQETTAPAGNPTAGFAICWFDNVSHTYTCRNSSGAITVLSTNPCPTTGGASCLVNTDASGNVNIMGTLSVPNTVSAGTQTMNPGGTTATDSAGLGPELTSAGTCSGTGWTGTYPNYLAPATTAPLTCTGFTSGNFYQLVTVISGNAGVTGMTYASGLSCSGTGTYPLTVTGGGGSGASGTITVTSGAVTAAIAVVTPGTAFTSAPTTGTLGTPTGSASCTGTLVMTSTIGGGSITVGIGTAQISAASSSTLTFGPKANATSLTYTPQASFVGTINISAKLITPISTYSYVAKDSTGATSFHALYQTLGSLYNFFLGGGGAYNTTGYSNSAQGANALYSNTTGGSNSAQGYQSLYSNTTGSSNSAQGVNALNSNTTGSYNYGAGYQAGRYISDGSTANQTSSYSIYLGTNPMALNSGDDNEIVIGGDATGGATGAGSNTTTIGTPRQTDVYFGGTGIPSNIHAGFYMGPATAPSGSCTTNGAWVFSQDGHATFCNSGTWATKI